MKIVNILLFVLFIPALCKAQYIGLGGQYSQKSDGQFFVNGSAPIINKGENNFISSGLEFTTSGGAKLAGLNIKPIQLNLTLNKNTVNSPITYILGLDAGYLFDFRNGHKNTLVVTPTLYMEYSFFFVKAGYDIDTFHGNSQFFIRVGIGLGPGFFNKLGCTMNRNYAPGISKY